MVVVMGMETLTCVRRCRDVLSKNRNVKVCVSQQRLRAPWKRSVKIDQSHRWFRVHNFKRIWMTEVVKCSMKTTYCRRGERGRGESKTSKRTTDFVSKDWPPTCQCEILERREEERKRERSRGEEKA